jgi:hypothetical protein
MSCRSAGPAATEPSTSRPSSTVDKQLWLGRCADIGLGNPWRAFDEVESGRGDVQDGEVGDDALDDALAGQ